MNNYFVTEEDINFYRDLYAPGNEAKKKSYHRSLAVIYGACAIVTGAAILLTNNFNNASKDKPKEEPVVKTEHVQKNYDGLKQLSMLLDDRYFTNMIVKNMKAPGF